MSVSTISTKNRQLLWGMAAGRCQYAGCNRKLYEDSLTNTKMNKSYIAHIIADKPNGPRGNSYWSPKLKNDLSNIMLMCDEHHRRIDREDKEGHPVELLQHMKQGHEAEMVRLTSMMPEQRSHVILYGARIGDHEAPLSYKRSALALKDSGRYPASTTPIKLGMVKSNEDDSAQTYWDMQIRQLERAFNGDVKPLINDHEIQHFSVFGLAPQPLLIKLGVLLADINSVAVFQKHRVPDTWAWQGDQNLQEFKLKEPTNKSQTPVLIISLSATISNDRIFQVLGSDISIWTITIDNPNNDCIKCSSQLDEFGRLAHATMDKIKIAHGQDSELHVCPAMPVSTAIEFGKIWMLKADLPLIIYDQNNATGGFTKTITIKHHNNDE
jgi:hypothetical protein